MYGMALALSNIRLALLTIKIVSGVEMKTLAIVAFALIGALTFIVNKLYIKDLIGDGFKVKSVKVGTLEQVSISVGLPMPALEAAA